MDGTIARSARRVFAAVSMLAAFASAGVARAGEDAALVSVATGSLRGILSSGVVAFRGIPYAAPPVGDLRWMPPAPALAWNGVRDAGDYGASCEQASAPERVPFGSRAATMSEDCLTLNVWTPAVRAGSLPVMVWLHGGGNTSGTGSERYYDGASFARDGVVLVTLNYRLGLFGFFAHRALDSGAAVAGEGNFGLLDQIAALRWVRANIAAFGGDPANVTLFGESAGGEDTVVLATSDLTNGLFARAIAESAGALWSPFPAKAQAEERGAKLAEAFGVPAGPVTAAQLRAVPAGKIAAAGDDDQIGIVDDGRLVAGPAATAFEGAPHVPMIVGTNDDEGSLVAGIGEPDKLFPSLSRASMAAIRATYAARGIVNDVAVTRALFRDGYFTAPARWVAARATSAGHPAYLYRFDYVASVLAPRRPAATHGSEIPFVFETFEPSLLDDTDRGVESAMHGCWVAFAKTGVPDCPGTPAWSAFDPKSGRRMVFDARPSMRDPDDAVVLDALERDLLKR